MTQLIKIQALTADELLKEFELTERTRLWSVDFVFMELYEYWDVT